MFTETTTPVNNTFTFHKSVLKRKYQLILGIITPHPTKRWIFTGSLFLIYSTRVIVLGGWYIVSYALGLYLLGLFLTFLQPKFDPSLEMELARNECDDDSLKLPTRSDDEFRPFIRKLPELKFWLSATRSIAIALWLVLFRAFDIPVFWPILLIYFCLIFIFSMKRQIRHMIKYHYIPFNIGKKSY